MYIAVTVELKIGMLELVQIKVAQDGKKMHFPYYS
jgi:hypothetical protein